MNSDIIQVYQLYVDLERGNIGETLVDYWDVLASFLENVTSVGGCI